MKPAPDVCSACGAKIVMYRHGLSVPLVRGLDALASAGGGPVNLSQLDLTRNQWDNFQKLRYFGLVEQHAVNGRRKAGVWAITERGREFLAGRITIRKTAITYRGEVEDWDGPRVLVTDVDDLYQPRETWAAEAMAYEP